MQRDKDLDTGVLETFLGENTFCEEKLIIHGKIITTCDKKFGHLTHGGQNGSWEHPAFTECRSQNQRLKARLKTLKIRHRKLMTDLVGAHDPNYIKETVRQYISDMLDMGMEDE